MDQLTDEDLRHLRRAITLSRYARNRGNGPFGAVLAKAGAESVEAENTVSEERADPTCHAEMNALREGARYWPVRGMKKLTLYCSCEPCPMCAAAAYWSGVGRIVYAASAEAYCEHGGAGFALGCRQVLESARPPMQVEVLGPCLEVEAVDIWK